MYVRLVTEGWYALSTRCWLWGVMAACILGLLAQPVHGQSGQAAPAFPDPVCLSAFEPWAYRTAELIPLEPFAYPTPAWTLAASVPVEVLPPLPAVDNAVPRIRASVVADRQFNGQHELWVFIYVVLPGYSASLYAIYRPQSNEWVAVPDTVQDPNLFIWDLFVTPDGRIWGSHQWFDQALPALSSVPVLSRFNELTGQFELVPNSPTMTISDRSSVLTTHGPDVLLDQAGVFWIFNIDSNLYRYDPAQDVSEARIDLATLAPFGVGDMALAPDGSIYFNAQPAYGRPDLSDDALFQYFPQSNTIVPVALPEGRWPSFFDLYIDSRHWIWLATVGYRDAMDEWHLLHASVDEFFDASGREWLYSAPEIRTEMSDGRLWVERVVDGMAGMGWLNPLTGEGCIVSTSPRRIYEDQFGYVWMGYGEEGQLYNYDARGQE